MMAGLIGQQQRGSGPLIPHSYDLGDMEAPWNAPITVARYMASIPVTIKAPVVYCADIDSPSGASVTVEAWMNGVFVGDFQLARGKNQFAPSNLKAFDKIELRIVTRGTGDPAPATVKDLWVMFCT